MTKKTEKIGLKIVTTDVTVKFKKLDPEAVLPMYLSEGASAADLSIRTLASGMLLPPGKIQMFKTGLAVEVPPGYELQIRSRSGLAAKGIVVVNSPGTIDSDYRGEICVVLANYGHQAFNLPQNSRVAQLVLAKVERISFKQVAELSPTARGIKGFGSTGI